MENTAIPTSHRRSLRVTSYFARRQSGATSTPEASRAPRPRFRNARVLLVEDDQGLRQALKERLCHDGCKVTEAADGVSARWSLLSFHYDAVIMDLSLPNSSGVDVMKDVSQTKDLPPVLVLTGGDAEDRDRARAMGATFVLRKPSSYADVANTLDRLLG